MRFLLTLMGICLAILSIAQVPSPSLRIQISFEKEGRYLEQAIQTIEAVNTVGKGTTVDYQAGQSIILLPGFIAKNGSIFTADIKPVGNKGEVSLQLNAYPNPFDHSTVINFDLPEAGIINLSIINEKGQIIEHLLENSQQTAGKHQYEWKADVYSSGIYFPVLRTERQQISKRIIKK